MGCGSSSGRRSSEDEVLDKCRGCAFFYPRRATDAKCPRCGCPRQHLRTTTIVRSPVTSMSSRRSEVDEKVTNDKELRFPTALAMAKRKDERHSIYVARGGDNVDEGDDVGDEDHEGWQVSDDDTASPQTAQPFKQHIDAQRAEGRSKRRQLQQAMYRTANCPESALASASMSIADMMNESCMDPELSFSVSVPGSPVVSQPASPTTVLFVRYNDHAEEDQQEQDHPCSPSPITASRLLSISSDPTETTPRGGSILTTKDHVNSAGSCGCSGSDNTPQSWDFSPQQSIAEDDTSSPQHITSLIKKVLPVTHKERMGHRSQIATAKPRRTGEQNTLMHWW